MTGALDIDLQGLVMAAAHHAARRDEIATAEVFVRALPRNRNYLVVAGVDEAADGIAGLRFSADEVAHLRALPALRDAPDSFFAWLADYRFTGSVRAPAEGTPVFSGEPLLQITASLTEISLFETLTLATIQLATTAATKASRLVVAARGRDVIEFASRRAAGRAAAAVIARAAHLAGTAATSNVEAALRHGIPLVGAVSHAWVLAHEREPEAFARLLDLFPETDLVPLDTYDVEGALAALVELERPVRGVRIDSGDLATISRRVRAHLDAHGLAATIVTASGELDEYRIDELVCADAPIDRFGVGKQLATPADAPALGAVMKLVEIDGPDGVRRPAKRSPGKVNVAGAKQVMRRFDASGQALGDRVVARDASAESGERALLEAVIEGGVRMRPLEPLARARARAAEQLRALPPEVRRLAVPERFPVRFEIEG
ncbi:MAG: nicotinate phosphoribosyltransferase [bacterium]